jgi:nucleoside-diphosphate-sugar epimerase
MTDALKIAVLGAGYVGGALARTASQRGNAVWAVRRSADGRDADGVQWVRGDLAGGALTGLPESLDVVVLAVAPTRGADGYADTYPPAARTAVALAERCGARSLLYTSSTGVYGGRDGAWVTEDSPRLGVGESNEALKAAEDIILSASASRPTVVRVAGICGPGRDPRARMAAAASLPQRGEYWVNLVHRDDIVSALLHIVALPQPPSVLNCSDGAPTLAAEVARWLATARGEDATLLAFGHESLRSRNDQRVSTAALLATGWQPSYSSFRESLTRGL